MSKKIILLIPDGDDEMAEESEREFPAKNEVCYRCEGEGRHVNPAIDGNGITASEWAEWDYEEKESYLNGEYDVICEECNGNKVVAVIDEENLNPEQRVWYQRYLDVQRIKAEMDREDRYWSRLESGF